MARVCTVGAIALLLIGCRTNGGTSGGTDGGTGADASGDAVSIYEIQDGTRAAGDAVTLRNVVVVAIDSYGGAVGGFWVAEPEDHPTHGRAYSGVQVFSKDVAQVARLAVGDVVDIEGGEIKEFALDCFDPMPTIDCDDTLVTLTEIGPPQGGALTITKVGDGVVPAPVVVRAQDLAADATEAEKWESVLIEIDDVAVTKAPRASASDSTLVEMRVTGPMRVQSALAPLPDAARDDCYASVVGVLTYFFDWKLLPRATSDVAAASDASRCLYERSAADCGDDKDNDFDGFVDCADFSCQQANPEACSAAATVAQVQDGSLAEGTLVKLAGVVVTAVATDGEDLWVQDADSTADYSGVHVFRGKGAAALPATIGVGAIVDVSGTIEEFYDETEIAVDAATADVAFVRDAGVPAVRSDVTAATLGDETIVGEPYEGMLVEVANVSVVTADDGHGGFTVGAAGAQLTVDNQLFDKLALPAATGDCYKRIRGVMSYAFEDRKLYPRDASDVEPGGTCL